jgi:hypothetical protein
MPEKANSLACWRGRSTTRASSIFIDTATYYFTGLERMDLLDEDIVAALASSELLQSLRLLIRLD